MAIRQLPVTTGGTMLVPYNQHRIALNVFNNGTETCFLGDGPNVSTTNGYPILVQTGKGFAKIFGDDPRVERWAVSQTVNNTFSIYEEWDDNIPDTADIRVPKQ